MSASVILVDDQASTRMALGTLLRDAGYCVAVAEADAGLAARHYDGSLDVWNTKMAAQDP